MEQFHCIFLFPFILSRSLQSRENHGLLERLTNLASAHMNDVDTIQKLESELEKLTAQKRTYEEKGKKYKEDSEQVNYNCHLCVFILK